MPVLAQTGSLLWHVVTFPLTLSQHTHCAQPCPQSKSESSSLADFW